MKHGPQRMLIAAGIALALLVGCASHPSTATRDAPGSACLQAMAGRAGGDTSLVYAGGIYCAAVGTAVITVADAIKHGDLALADAAPVARTLAMDIQINVTGAITGQKATKSAGDASLMNVIITADPTYFAHYYDDWKETVAVGYGSPYARAKGYREAAVLYADNWMRERAARLAACAKQDESRGCK